MPLLWAHAEYIKLLRSRQDEQVFDLIPEVAERYLGQRQKCKSLSVWKFNRQVEKIELGYTLRIQATAPFRLHWMQDDWQTVEDTPSSSTALTIYFVDVTISENKATSIEFTFFWSDSNSWEGRNYQVAP